MNDDFEFDSIAGGGWVKGRDHLGEWVFVRVRNSSQRTNSFTGETEDVVRADWVFDLLGEGPHVIEKDLMVSGWIARRLVESGAKNTVVRIAQEAPKKPGQQGAIVAKADAGTPELARAQAKARAILAAEETTTAKPAGPKAPPVDTGEQELTDLLADL